MGERKVLNKYFPPDFDPSKVPRGKRVRSEEKQMKVRMMLPMSVRCNTCGNFMYKGTKFNTRMEDVKGEAYLGIKIFRFYYRCTNCSAEFCMKTDPKTADYIVEGGASRNYEPWRDKEQSTVDAVAQKEEEEKGNAMKALENRTLDSKREMDILTALDEMRSLKARHEKVDTETALAALRRAAAAEEEEGGPVDLDAEDEEAVRQMLLQRAGFVKRLEDSSSSSGEEEEEDGGDGVCVEKDTSNREKASRSGSRSSKRSRKDGGAPLSVAAAAWEEEADDGEAVEEEEDLVERQVEKKGSNNDRVRGSNAPIKDTDTQIKDTAKNRGNSNEAKTTAAAAAEHKKNEDVAWAGPLPPSVPSFSARPAAVVVKLKGVAAPVVQVKKKQLEVEKKKEEEEDDGNALLGLIGGYGSSDSD